MPWLFEKQAVRFSRSWPYVAALVLASIPGVARADGISPEARAHFKAGVAYLEDPEGQRFEEAFAEFKKAYELSQSPKVLGNLALCAMKLERDGEAIDAYTRYLADVADIDAGERAQIARDLQTLRASVVTVGAHANEPSAMIVDTRVPVRGANITNVYELVKGAATLRVRPGHHLLHLRALGRDLADWEFTAEAGEHITHRFETASAPTAEAAPAQVSASAHHNFTAPVLLTSLGVAALAVGGVLGVSTLQKIQTLENECPNNVCPSGVYSHDLGTARTFVTATDFTLLGGGLVAAVGIVWTILTAARAPEQAPPPSAGVAGACAGHGCYAAFHVGF